MMERMPVEEVIVLYGGDLDEEMAKRIVEETGALVIHLPEGMTLEMLDDVEMAKWGWVRRAAE